MFITKGLTEKWDMYITDISHFMHAIKYNVDFSDEKYDSSMLIFSIDVDVGNRLLGLKNKGINSANVHRSITEEKIGEVEQNAFPLFFEAFDKYEIPATFALRGQLLEVDGSLIDEFRSRSVEHEIGSHGFTHKSFTQMSYEEADTDLSFSEKIFRDFNIKPRSFVFPKNRVAHLDLLEKYGFKCFRDFGEFKKDGMYIKKNGELYDVHPSLYLDRYARIRALKTFMNIAVRKKRPLHIWFHMWNFGLDTDMIKKFVDSVFEPFLYELAKKRDDNLISPETMISSIDKISGGTC
jgi:hypothetical protein